MINSILQDQSFSELIKLRNYFQKRVYNHNVGDEKTSPLQCEEFEAAVLDIDEMIIAKYSEDTRSFYNHSGIVGN